MSKIQHDVMLRVVKILNVLMIELPFAACWFLYYSHQTYANLAWEGHFAILGLFFFLYIVLGKIYDAFWMSMQRVSELVYGQILGAMATDGILYIVICLMSAKVCNLLPGIAAIVGQLVMAAIWASCAHKWYYTTFPPQKTAVVYDVRHGMEKLINEYGLSQKYDVRVTLTIISRSFSMYRWTNLRSSSVTQHRLDGAKIRKISRKILKKLGVVHQMPESSF